MNDFIHQNFSMWVNTQKLLNNILPTTIELQLSFSVEIAMKSIFTYVTI